MGFVEGAETPTGLHAQVVAHDRLTLVVGDGHPWARRRGIDTGRLAATALVSREPGSGTRSVLEQQLHDASHGTPAAPAVQLGPTTAIKKAVIGGAGAAALSSLAVTDELAARTLVAVPIRGLDLRRALRAIWLPDQRLDGPARELVDIAQRRASARPVA